MEFVKKMSELYQLSAGSMELLMENMERILLVSNFRLWEERSFQFWQECS